MNKIKNVNSIIHLIAGILILLFQDILAIIVGVYLLVIGVLGLVGQK